MLDFDDGLLAIEMQIVFPPFIVDFASAQLDDPPDMIQDEGHTLDDLVRDRFGALADEVMAIYYELAARADVYVLDLHPHNIKFTNP